LDRADTQTVKVFLAASGLGAKSGIGFELVKEALARGRQVLIHVEELDDYLAIARLIQASPDQGSVHIVHVPHQRYSQLMRSLVDRQLTLETCPQYLLWSWTRGRDGCDVNPPVVPADLWTEIQRGRIDTIGTDHCSYTRQEKVDHGLPGFPGLETLLRVMYTCGVAAGCITWEQLSRVMSAGPARVLGLCPKKGVIQVGSDADLVIFDPGFEDLVGRPRFGRGDFSPFEGLSLRGRVVRTLVRGRQVYADGSADLDAAGWGTWQEPDK
jgi:dihydroorotase-like cyclic amidohydrolase